MKFLAGVILAVSLLGLSLVSDAGIKPPRVLLKSVPDPQLLVRIGTNAQQLKVMQKAILKGDFEVSLVEHYADLLKAIHEDMRQARGVIKAATEVDINLIQREYRKLYHQTRRISKRFDSWILSLEALSSNMNNVIYDIEALTTNERYQHLFNADDMKKLKNLSPKLTKRTEKIKNKLEEIFYSLR